MQLFSADPRIFKKKLNQVFVHKNFKKNGPQKLLIIGPDPFILQSSPDHSPQPRIDFLYYEISGADICFLICGFCLPYYYFIPRIFRPSNGPGNGKNCWCQIAEIQ
jgi:hypothetical protein